MPPYTLTGGVAKNRGMVAALKKILAGKVFVPVEPQIAGALGAALYVSGKSAREIASAI
jgi:activator of 2-hydroxyglutaryl-CoA dehydratase